MKTAFTAEKFMKLDLSGGVVSINPPCNAVIIGVAGVIKGQTARMSAAAETAELPVGVIEIQFSSIDPSGTTADEITVLW